MVTVASALPLSDSLHISACAGFPILPIPPRVFLGFRLLSLAECVGRTTLC